MHPLVYALCVYTPIWYACTAQNACTVRGRMTQFGACTLCTPRGRVAVSLNLLKQNRIRVCAHACIDCVRACMCVQLYHQDIIVFACARVYAGVKSTFHPLCTCVRVREHTYTSVFGNQHIAPLLSTYCTISGVCNDDSPTCATNYTLFKHAH
jgi:hypothetical protein